MNVAEKYYAFHTNKSCNYIQPKFVVVVVAAVVVECDVTELK
jgi:hypothetical protein